MYSSSVKQTKIPDSSSLLTSVFSAGLRKIIPSLVFAMLTGLCIPLSGQNQSWTLSDSLTVVQLTPNVWEHITLQYYPAFGTFTSNGLIYRSGSEAVIMDTPASNSQSRVLLEWWNNTYPETKVTSVIVNHFHEDALGGLEVFHSAGVKSYGHRRTKRLLRTDDPKATPPQHTFRRTQTIRVGERVVVNFYPGPAHTADNIVTWIPDEKVLFGGCMVKSLGANKGNVADANVKNWPAAISLVMAKFSDVRIVIPGHGDLGNKELLQYTAELFKN